jgi:hypothetical protein
MPWWLPIIIFAGLTAVGELLRPRPKFENAVASSLGDFQSPTSEEGRAVPVVFGTCHVKGPNVLWYGDYTTSPIKEKVSTGSIFGGSKKVTVGYFYYLGLQYGVCLGPIDEFVEVRYDDKALPRGIITVEAGKNDIEFRPTSGAGWSVASIPVGPYASFYDLAEAVEAAIVGAVAGPWRVVFGFYVVPDRTDRIVYAVDVGGVATKYVVQLRPGRYTTGAEMVSEVCRALNENEAAIGSRGTFSPAWNARTSEMTITFSPSVGGFMGWHLYAGATAEFDLSKTALVSLGFDTGVDDVTSDFTNKIAAPFPVDARRFSLSYQDGTAELRLSSAAFTARVLLGFATGGTPTDATGLGARASDYELRETGTSYFAGPDSTRVDVYAPNLFGGEKAEGGIAGTLDVYHGTATQEASAYLEGAVGASLPAYRGLCYAVARRMYIGTNLYIKPISFVVKRVPNGLGLTGGHHDIGGDANPAAVLYEILVDTLWGAGIPASLIDTASFLAAGETLFSEGLGVSIMFDSSAEAGNWIEEVLRHIDGVIFEDPNTAKLTLKLARADYTVPGLPLVDEDVADSVTYSRPSWDDTSNTVRVTYVDRSSDFMERTVKANNLAAIQALGGIETIEELPFRGLSNEAAARKAAARALKAVSHPAARIELTVNRTVWVLRPGSVFRFSWASLGITDLPMRVVKIDVGMLSDAKIKIEAIEDIFGVPWTAYSAPAASDWIDPAALPPALLAARADEVPYALLDAESTMVMTAGVPGAAGITMGYEVFTDPDGGEEYRLTERVQSPTPSGLLVADVPAADTSMEVADGFDLLSIDNITDADLTEGRNLALIDDEIIAFQYWNRTPSGSYQLEGAVRGVMDTVPADHSLGARVWIMSGGLGLAKPEPYPVGATISVKLAPFNRRGTAPISDASPISITTVGRSTLPLAPTALTVNGLSFPTNVADAIALAWSHRDRLADWSFADAGATASPEATVTYTLRIYDETDSLIRTVTGITGTSYSYALATEIADTGIGRANGVLRVSLEAVRGSDAAVSLFRLEDTFDCAGWGMLYGNYWGGNAG